MKKYQVKISIILFLIVFLVFSFTTKLKFQDIQLSYFGVHTKYKIFWNLTIILLSFTIFSNFNNLINLKNFRYKRIYELYSIIISFSLFMVGFIPMTYKIHSVCAYIYFMFYPLMIYSFIFFNRDKIKNFFYYEFISMLMMLIPLILLFIFKGKAWAEIIHTFFVILINFRIGTQSENRTHIN